MVLIDDSILQVENVSFSYHGGDTVLKNVSFQININQSTVLLGPNGAGKSTLMFNLLGLYRPQQGRIMFRGKPLADVSEETLRHKLAYIFQNPDDQVFAPTVREDILFGPSQFSKDVLEMKHKLDELTILLQIDHLLERNPRHLSYGEKRRVALAGVLIMEPEIIFFDEPLAFLDPPGRKRFIEILDQLLQQGKSLFIATHDLDFAAEWGERFLILEKGQITDIGDKRIFQKGIKAFDYASPITTQIFQEFLPTAELPITIADGRKKLKRLMS